MTRFSSLKKVFAIIIIVLPSFSSAQSGIPELKKVQTIDLGNGSVMEASYAIENFKTIPVVVKDLIGDYWNYETDALRYQFFEQVNPTDKKKYLTIRTLAYPGYKETKFAVRTLAGSRITTDKGVFVYVEGVLPGDDAPIKGFFLIKNSPALTIKFIWDSDKPLVAKVSNENSNEMQGEGELQEWETTSGEYVYNVPSLIPDGYKRIEEQVITQCDLDGDDILDEVVLAKGEKNAILVYLSEMLGEKKSYYLLDWEHMVNTLEHSNCKITVSGIDMGRYLTTLSFKYDAPTKRLKVLTYQEDDKVVEFTRAFKVIRAKRNN